MNNKFYIRSLIIGIIFCLIASCLFADVSNRIYFDKYWLIGGYGAEIWFVYVDSTTHAVKRCLIYLETEPITEFYIIQEKIGYFEKIRQYNKDVLIKIYLPEETQSNKTLISE